jgi:hypothetical protein
MSARHAARQTRQHLWFDGAFVGWTTGFASIRCFISQSPHLSYTIALFGLDTLLRYGSVRSLAFQCSKTVL